MAEDGQGGSTSGEPGDEDRSEGLLQDLATSSPPKSLDTVTAASEAAEKAEDQGGAEIRAHRIRARAYELWEQQGRPEGRPTDFWLSAEEVIAREDAKG